jgi:hypothetical protein
MTIDDHDDIHLARRRPLRFQDWDSWLDKAIDEARERGEFDNLPARGKPLRFDANPLTGEVDVGHGLLKSAGYAPAWIELDKEIRAVLDDLATLRKQAADRLTTPPEPPDANPIVTPSRSWWRALFGRSRTPTAVAPRALPRRAPDAECDAARRQYLARAREIDAKIAAYNASLPPDLWRLERPRLPPERAAKDFDGAITEGKRSPD